MIILTLETVVALDIKITQVRMMSRSVVTAASGVAVKIHVCSNIHLTLQHCLCLLTIRSSCLLHVPDLCIHHHPASHLARRLCISLYFIAFLGRKRRYATLLHHQKKQIVL